MSAWDQLGWLVSHPKIQANYMDFVEAGKVAKFWVVFSPTSIFCIRRNNSAVRRWISNLHTVPHHAILIFRNWIWQNHDKYAPSFNFHVTEACTSATEAISYMYLPRVWNETLVACSWFYWGRMCLVMLHGVQLSTLPEGLSPHNNPVCWCLNRHETSSCGEIHICALNCIEMCARNMIGKANSCRTKWKWSE